jgi:glutamyl-tRNA synthetase
MAEQITRLAPSPTGALHLGNARTFVLNWLLARQRGWRIIFRMEDLDGPRIKAGADQQALRVLRWLGLDWDSEVLYQSTRADQHRWALEQLIAKGLAYPCTCSRKEIERAASAPATEDLSDGAYPGLCRGRWDHADHARAETGRPVAWRVMVDDEPIVFTDHLAGPQSFDLSRTSGDFIIFRGEGMAAYQLAVVVDDEQAGVNAVVRGHDLLESAAMQLHLRRLLGYAGPMEYWHVPLVAGPDGRKLAKRHGDTRLIHYLESGTPPQRVLGLIGYWSGLLDRRDVIDLPGLLERFDPAKIPPHEITYTDDDEAFLTE